VGIPCRPCGNLACPNLVERGQRWCPSCRPSSRWGDKTGTTPRTATYAHQKSRARILRRDPVCRLQLPGCEQRSVILDHIVPVAAAGIENLTTAQIESDANKRGVCQACSNKISSQQGHWFASHRVETPWTAADVERLRVLPSSNALGHNIPRAILAGGINQGNRSTDRDGKQSRRDDSRGGDRWGGDRWGGHII
jgi:hypothetical protein